MPSHGLVSMMPFRKSDAYKKKLLRIGAALRVFSNTSGVENNFNSLANEAAALEELSLSAYSLMKSIKAEIEEAAKKKSCIIVPSSYSRGGDEDK